jgi:uncharacterized membrane protein
VKQALVVASESTILIINALALIVIVVGTAEVFFNGVPAMLVARKGLAPRNIWLRFERWLVVALTFQLAADIIETSISSGWDAVGRIAAIAAIRSSLNYLLERDLSEVRRVQRMSATESPE